MFEVTRPVFIAFGDHYRQEIILLLGETHNLTVQDLSVKLGLSRPATSHHVKILKEAGLLGEHRDGRKTYYYPTLKQSVTQIKTLVDAADQKLSKEQ
jgi:DNA-binding transcriptional ArsR family regulator